MIRCGGSMSAGQGRDYYNNEYSRGDYYAQDAKEIPGTWSGKAADELGLSGAIQKSDFEALLEGKAGANRPQLVAGEVGTDKHRAAWDFTASPDKSVSVMALVGGDTRIVAAVERANAKALSELERFAMAKDRDRKLETTGNLVVASFKHESSRKLDPQLHIHNVVMNMTQRADGKVVALETKEMYAAQRLASGVFHSELARELKALGYEIEVRDKGSVAIKGVSKDLCDDFSKRRKDIEQYLDTRGQSGARAAENAAIRTRDTKNRDVSQEDLQAAWRSRANDLGIDLGTVRNAAKYNLENPKLTQQVQERIEKGQAVLAVRYAVEHLSERKATYHGRELESVAIRHAMGQSSIEQIREAMKADHDLIRVQGRSIPSDLFTTNQAVKMEMRNIAIMRDGKGAGETILGNQPFSPGKPLSADQQRVAHHILNNKDQVIAVEGKAGAGKTYTLESVTKAAQEQGWIVRGFAPTTSAAKTLSEAGMETKTIAALASEKATPVYETARKDAYERTKESLIASQMNLPAAERVSPERIEQLSNEAASSIKPQQIKQLWVVDEAGLMSSKQAAAVLEKAKESGAKVVFVGDRLQHSAVEAGKPFAYMQEAGLKAERLDEIRRQKNEELKAAVIDASEGRTKESVRRMEANGKVREIGDKAERHQAVAQEYMKTKEGQSCLVVAPSNAERRELNRLIREELIKAGSVEKGSFKAEIRVSKGWTTAEKRDVASYQVGDHLRVTSNSRVFQVRKGEEGRVVAVDAERRSVHLELKDGRKVIFNPDRFRGVEASSLEERRLAVGDRIQYREAMKPEGTRLKVDGERITNGETGTIKSLDRETQKAVVRLDGGKTVTLDLSKPQPVDHAYAVTSHSSQGKTVDRALVVADTSHTAELVNKQQYYVSISRARHEAVVFTDSKANLAAAVSRDAGKSSALELVSQGRTTGERQRFVDMNKGSLSREDLQTMKRTGPPINFNNSKEKDHARTESNPGTRSRGREGREPGREPGSRTVERSGTTRHHEAAGNRTAARLEQPRGRADRAVPPATDRRNHAEVRSVPGRSGSAGQTENRRNLDHAGAGSGRHPENHRVAGQGRFEHQDHRDQRGLNHQAPGPDKQHGRSLGAGAQELRGGAQRDHALTGGGERQASIRADVGQSRTSIQQSLHVAMDHAGPVHREHGRDAGAVLAQPAPGERTAATADRSRAAGESQAAATLKTPSEAERRLSGMNQAGRPASEAEQRFAALKQDSRIVTFDQELRNLETRKTKVLEQGMPQESKRATIEAIDRNMDQVKQQLGAELKAMEPRIQAAAQTLEKVAQDLKMQPPKLNLEGMKPEGARAASEFVKASSVAQQAFQSAMAAGGGNKELQKAMAAVKAAVEAAQAISNPVSLAKTAAHVAKHVISMER